MKNIILDGQTYSGISEVSLPISGGTALFKDKDEIVEPTGSLSITANGTYDVTDKASAVVNVPAPEINLQNKTATANGTVTADEGYDGLGTVTVAVSGDTPTYQEKTATTNGVVLPDEGYDALSKVTVAVPAPETPTPTISVDASGLVTAIAGDKSATHQLSATDDADFLAENIKEGVNIFGVLGTLAGGSSSALITGESYLANVNISKKIPIGKSVSRYIAVWCLNDTAMEAAKSTTSKLIAGVSAHNIVIPSNLDAELYSGTLMDWCYGYSFSATDPLTIRGLNPADVSIYGQDDENFVISNAHSAYEGSSKKYKWAVIDLSEVL